jgi:hypothetical protein
MVFKAGEVWEWSGIVYLLLRRDLEKELWTTVKTSNQQVWHSLNLIDGSQQEIRIHTSVFSTGVKWERVS